jgi:hypothetical protein
MAQERKITAEVASGILIGQEVLEKTPFEAGRQLRKAQRNAGLRPDATTLDGAEFVVGAGKAVKAHREGQDVLII